MFLLRDAWWIWGKILEVPEASCTLIFIFQISSICAEQRLIRAFWSSSFLLSCVVFWGVWCMGSLIFGVLPSVIFVDTSHSLSRCWFAYFLYLHLSWLTWLHFSNLFGVWISGWMDGDWKLRIANTGIYKPQMPLVLWEYAWPGWICPHSFSFLSQIVNFGSSLWYQGSNCAHLCLV